MKIENKELMKSALASLNGKWGVAIGVTAIWFLISGVFVGADQIQKHSSLLQIIIAGPLSVGIAYFFLLLSRNQEVKFEMMFSGFNLFGKSLAAYLLVVLFTLLWMLLLIIPGIIASISYSMTFFIIADDNSIGAMEAIDKSKKMMYGYKWKFFCLGCRFIGWALLCILTLGIGFLWLMPYMYVSFGKFYDDIKKNPIEATAAPVTA